MSHLVPMNPKQRDTKDKVWKDIVEAKQKPKLGILSRTLIASIAIDGTWSLNPDGVFNSFVHLSPHMEYRVQCRRLPTIVEKRDDTMDDNRQVVNLGKEAGGKC